MNLIKKITTVIFLSLFIFQASYTEAAINSLEIVSKNSSDVLGNSSSENGYISEDGNFLVFASDATNLVDDDTNDQKDIFVYNFDLNIIERVSVSSLGVEADAISNYPAISDDGQYVVFYSEATNLVDGDTNDLIDVFIHDRDTGVTELISIAEDDGPSDGESYEVTMSSDGRYVVFNSSSADLISGDTNGVPDIYMRDTVLDVTTRVSVNSDEEELDGESERGIISRNGRYVLFTSSATNATDDILNDSMNVYLRDLTLGTTELISSSSDEVSGNDNSSINSPSEAITNDGRYVLFSSKASNLVSGDTNGYWDIFVRDRTLGTTTRINLSNDGAQANGESILGGVDPGGRFFSFSSDATNLVPNDTNDSADIFVYDMELDSISRVSVNTDGEEANNNAYSLQMFSNGARYIMYWSEATNLVPGDTNGAGDIFFGEIVDEDGVSSDIEDAAPNSGDADESGYDDAIESNVSSFVNSVTGNYTMVKTTGECTENSSITSEAESELAAQDSGYDYPLGIITFSVDCKDAGETATVSVYCFCENTPVSGTIARKYSESTGEYTTIDSAVIEEVTIDGQRALKMTYDVTDGGLLDEDGLENGTIIDPVGFAREVAVVSSGGGSSSSGSRPRNVLIAQNTLPVEVTDVNENTCSKYSFVTSMKKGSKFGEVSKLQELLNKEGINVGLADGLFGPMTDAGVKAFQTANTLDSDGIVGPMTRAALNEICF